MSVVRCECCQGRKKMMGLGMLMKDCRECLGVGFIEKPVVAVKRVRKAKEVVPESAITEVHHEHESRESA
jgi:hypothetical protein